MKTINVTLMLITLLFLLNTGVSNAKSATKRPDLRLSTKMEFDGLSVNGQRQSPFGATAVVETEKDTLSLIDYRSNYNDRIKNSRFGR